MDAMIMDVASNNSRPPASDLYATSSPRRAEDTFAVIDAHSRRYATSKYRLGFTWYMVWMARNPTSPQSALEMWLEIIGGKGEEGDLWLWQEDDEEYLKTAIPAFVCNSPDPSQAEWRMACEALERHETRTRPRLLEHLTFRARMRVIRWLIVAGPGRHDHLHSGGWKTFQSLIKSWGDTLDGADFADSARVDFCRICNNISQWLDVWVETMLEVYSCHELRSFSWRCRCRCLEKKLGDTAAQPNRAERNRDSVISRVLDGLVVSPWPLILWVTFRLMEPTPTESFQIFLDILRGDSATDICTWDDVDDCWLSQRIAVVGQSTTNPKTLSWFNLYPAIWHQYMIELTPPQWQLVHELTWRESRLGRRLAPEHDTKLRLAALFHTYASILLVLFTPIDILNPLGFGSSLSFFDAIAPSELRARGIMQPPRLASASQDTWTIPALNQWLQEWEKQLYHVAWHATPDVSHLDRIECMLLVVRLKIPHNFVVYAFPFILRRSERRLNQFREFIRRCEEWDILTSLANYGSAVEILFNFLQNSPWGPQTSLEVSNTIYVLMSHDIATIFAKLALILREPKSYKAFLRCRGILAQRLLDLLQELLDYNMFLAVRPLIFKAMERLSRASGLHPRCFALSGLQQLGRQVAAGGFGDIWKSSIHSQTVSVKVMRLFEEADVQAMLKEFGREALIWRQLSHPNLLPFFGMYYLDNRLCLVSPWMENGNILQFMAKVPSHAFDRLSLILDVAIGLEYLHAQQVVHGDLKGMNILVTPSHRACIADFGLSSVVGAMSVKFTHSTPNVQAGTMRWQAPELLRAERTNHFGSDIYAFACVCYEIIAQKVPLYELPEVAIPFKVATEKVRPSRPASWPETTAFESTWELLQDCWQENPDTRPTISDIIKRLVGPLIQAKPTQSAADWDERFSSKFRRSLEDRPLLPSVAEIERKLFSLVP